MGTEKSPDPTDRMGIYKRLSAVPDCDRLRRYNDRYADCDTWGAFVEAQDNAFDSKYYEATIRKTERTWKAHMAERGRHHALAQPVDVETWCQSLASTRTLSTVYAEYWVRLEQFYHWLQWRTDHPHRYQPVLMAAATCETAGGVWAEKVDFDPREACNV